MLFDATWIARTPGAGALIGETAAFTVVDRSTFTTWETAWRGDDGPRDVLRPDLLDVPGVTVLAATEPGGTIATGAVLFANTNAVVGVANVFAPSGSLDAMWRGIVAWTALHVPDATVVGYESGADLAAAWRIGFEPVAPLRVWSRDA